MTDFTQHLIDSRSEQLKQTSPGASFAKDVKAKVNAAESKRMDGKFQSAYETAGLDSSGVPDSVYDFREAFANGSTFKPAQHGGVSLPNRHIKEFGAEIAGRDFRSSRQMRNKWEGGNGAIETGLSVLRNSKVDTKMGSPWDDVDGLNRIALGMYQQGGTFDDFKSELENTPWSQKLEQSIVAWNAATTTQDSIADVESGGAKWLAEAEGEVDGYEPVEPTPITEDELPTNADWVNAAKTIYQFQTGEDPASLSDEELSDQLKQMMGLFWYNLPEMMLMANQAKNSDNPEYAQAFMKAMDIYEGADMNNMAEMGRFFKGQVSDMTNYATFGGGVIMTRLAAKTMREGVKKSLIKMMAGLSTDTMAGGAAGGAMEHSVQTAEVAGGRREEVDSGEVAAAAGESAALTAAVGGPINVMADPSLRSYASKSTRKGWSNLINKPFDNTPPQKRDSSGRYSK